MEPSDKNLALVYDYKGHDGYMPSSVNLGDYIQTLAALQFYPKVDGFIDRDSLIDLQDSHGKAIINGWYHLFDGHRLPENFNPLMVSMNISGFSDNSDFLNVLNSWKRFEPIGCRDENTVKILKEKGIAAYFSSCLTTTFKRVDSARKGVVLSDLLFFKSIFEERGEKVFPINRLIKKKVREFKYSRLLKKIILKTCNYGKNIKYVTHEAPLSLSHEERFEKARELLDVYSKAELVITSRIHAALPCLGLGTPVILVVHSKDISRYEGLEDLFNHIYMKEGVVAIKVDNRGRVVNSDSYKKYAERLTEKCIKYMGG